MILHPRFKPHFHVEVSETEQVVYLLSEKKNYALSGRLYVLLAPFLNGRYSLSDIVEQLKNTAPSSQIYYAMSLLESRGYIAESRSGMDESCEAFWHLMDVNPEQAADSLKKHRVSVKTLCPFAENPLLSLLSSEDIRIEDNGDFLIVVTDDYQHPELGAVNRESIQLGRPWLLVKPVGAVIWAGPIFIPGETGCWRCLDHRLERNREIERTIKNRKQNVSYLPVSRASLPATVHMACALAATETVKWLACKQSQLVGTIVSVDTAACETQSHVLVKRPQCDCCGSAERGTAEIPHASIDLTSVKKRFTDDGGHRSCSPESVYEKYRHHISPITGIVTDLRPLTNEDTPCLNVHLASHSFSTGHSSLSELRHVLRNKSVGKGKTRAQSRAGGLCEAIERYSMQYFGNEPKITAAMEELGDAAVHPNDCMLFSEAQYAERHARNSAHGPEQWIPAPFDPEARVEWAPLWSFTRRETRYLPMGLCYYGYPAEYCVGDSNGNAAGAVIEEAVLQGFLELAERDCVAVWWYNRLKRPGVDLGSFDEPCFRTLKDYYKSIQREFWVLDITSDFNVPAFAAVSRRLHAPTEDIVMGYGAHLDPKLGVLRAVTELNQQLYVMQTAANTSKKAAREQQLVERSRRLSIKEHVYLRPDDQAPCRTLSDFPAVENDDLLDDINLCNDMVRKKGMEILILDLTRRDIGMPVVKIVVPGLRFHRARFAPGRLYDVPHQMKWLNQPLKENQLNPWWL